MDELSKYTIKVISKNKIAVLTDENRVSVLEEISKELNAEYDTKPVSDSSIGRVLYNDIYIYAKPLSKQGNKSAGIDNEILLYDTLRQNLKKNVILYDRYKHIEIPNIKEVERTASDTANRKKADIVLRNNNKEYRISLKKDDAEIWESADSYYKTKAINLINKNKDKILSMDTYYKIVPNIAKKATLQEELDVVFGSDILGNGSVIFKTFTSNSFNITDSSIEIDCTNIIETQKDLKDKSVYFLIRNDKTRTGIPDYPGIRVLAVSESRITSKITLL